MGPEQRGRTEQDLLASILSEKPVPSHFGEENASSFSAPSSSDTMSDLMGTRMGALITRDDGGLASCLSIAVDAAVSCPTAAPAGSPAKMPAQSRCEGCASSSGRRTTEVPLRMCLGGLFLAFFLPFLGGEGGPTADGDLLNAGDLGLWTVGELLKAIRRLWLSLSVGLAGVRRVAKLLALMGGTVCCCVCNMLSSC